jgi:hypothetical protein
LTDVSEEVTTFITLMMEAVNSAKTSVNINQTIRRYIPGDSHFHTGHRENLRSHPESNSSTLVLRIHDNLPSLQFSLFKMIDYQEVSVPKFSMHFSGESWSRSEVVLNRNLIKLA